MARISRLGTKFMMNPSPAGFGIRFYVGDDQSISARVTFDESKEGGRGIVHGGAISAVLDEAMGAAAYENGHAGYTATMTFNYKSHIPLYEEIVVRAWIEKVDGKKIYAKCNATLPDDTIAVTGEGLFIASPVLQKQLDQMPSLDENES